ncbi:MAG TPA: sugar phosphate isomerase/epimerase family protein [Terracidiphilus sp.]|jgi:sugar phosphate isomerase/epimerase|nr:sugar phosphate isomerase/epimerase family protein [Terracidiphilus sp.]
MMKTSFSTLACPDWNLNQVLEAAVKYGFDGVELRVISGELDLWKLDEFQRGSLARTREHTDDLGLRIASVDSSACFHSPDAQERQRNIDSALRVAEIAAGLGAPAVRVFPDRIQSGSDRTQTARWIADSLVDVAQKLESSGVQVWLETHGDFATGKAVNEILQRVNRSDVGIIWDPANAFSQNSESPSLSQEMQAHLRHVHVKDLKLNAAGTTNYVLTGEGDFPFGAMFAALEAVGYLGFVSFEWEKQWHPELAPPEVALPHFMHWWNDRKVNAC